MFPGDDSKTKTKDSEPQEESSTPKTSPPMTKQISVGFTKIPTKLAPLRKSSLDRLIRRKDNIKNTTPIETSSRSDNMSTIVSTSSSNSSISPMTDRASRDYTNIIFQDPKFYETPRLLNSPERELKFKEIVKRSESMSPRYEKDWEQLSSKFTTDDNVIDIDKLSASSLITPTSESHPETMEKFDKEKHPRNIIGQQKELTLTGGGSMFLKSNKSRDNTPCQESARLEDFQLCSQPPDNISINENVAPGERPKSILREKPTAEDGE